MRSNSWPCAGLSVARQSWTSQPTRIFQGDGSGDCCQRLHGFDVDGGGGMSGTSRRWLHYGGRFGSSVDLGQGRAAPAKAAAPDPKSEAPDRRRAQLCTALTDQPFARRCHAICRTP